MYSNYADEQGPTASNASKTARPLSFMPSSNEVYESRGSIRGGGYFDPHHGSSPTRNPLERTRSHEKGAGGGSSPKESGSLSPQSLRGMGAAGEGGNGGGAESPPRLSGQGSTDTAVQQFPLNDIDYESSPAAVAQELSNLQAIRRMSMNVDTGDPDLAGFGGVPAVAPKRNKNDDDDASRLFWVPARLHPELAPKEFKTFIEDRVDKIRRRSGDSESLSVDGMEQSGSASSSLRRKKSMLSHQIDTKGEYEDGAERLERKRSKGMRVEGQTAVANLEELESLVNDPQQLMRRLSIDTARRSQDSGIEVPASEDMPILPPGGPTLKRSTRTTYRKGSLRKGERVPMPRRLQERQSSEHADDSRAQSPTTGGAQEREPILGLTRIQTEPTSLPSGDAHSDYQQGDRQGSRRRAPLPTSHSSDNLASSRDSRESARSPPPEISLPEEEHSRQGPQPRQFHSRLASGGRTTAQLPGYNNSDPLPQVVETRPDGTKAPAGPIVQQQYPERKSSHELSRPMHRGGAHMRPVPGRQQQQPTSTLDDISSNPSPLPGSGSTRTDALTMVPTFDDRKVDRRDSGRKSSWKWILGNDDDDKDKEKRASKAEKALDHDGPSAKGKSGKLAKAQAEKARLDVLQHAGEPVKGRESLVLNRADVQLEDERKKESKKASEGKRDKDRESSLLSAIFGGKKKSADLEAKEKKRKSDRYLSPEPMQRILKPDIDYNWTRFSILEERAIYRMAHIKLANPRRALYSQVLLSNFMYSYLAKVQALHPQMQIPAQQKQQQQQQQQQQQEQQQQQQQQQQHQQQQQQQRAQDSQQQPAEYSQYQRWQEVS